MTQHIHSQISDYVLGLLPWNEQQQVDQHTQGCADCRRALRQEQELGRLVHTTLAAAAQPPVNLRQFMPPVPQKSAPFQIFGVSLNWQQQLAPLMLVFFLLLGSVGFFLSEQRSLWRTTTPTALAVTATTTNSPTAAITETRLEETQQLVTTAVPHPNNQPTIIATPAPNPTPIAALNVNRDA
jgi:anti-sigma factor RsiW